MRGSRRRLYSHRNLVRRDGQARVVPAEAERVRQRHLLLVILKRLGEHVGGSLGIGCFEASGRRHAIVRDGERRNDRLDRACRAERVARRALDRAHGDLKAGLFAAQCAQRLGLGELVGVRSCAMRVEMSQVSRGKPAFFKRDAHRTDDTFALRVGGGHVVGIARRAEAGDFR